MGLGYRALIPGPKHDVGLPDWGSEGLRAEGLGSMRRLECKAIKS